MPLPRLEFLLLAIGDVCVNAILTMQARLSLCSKHRLAPELPSKQGKLHALPAPLHPQSTTLLALFKY